jgi:hypothetical protein
MTDGPDALSRIDKHEAVCTERWEQLRQSNQGLNERLASIERRISALPWWLVGSIVSAGLLYVVNHALQIGGRP